MPDLNKLMESVRSSTDNAKSSVEKLMVSYDALLRECNTQYMAERMASSGEVDRDFYNLLHLIKRNRNVVGSLMRGVRGIRNLNGYRFIEEDTPNKKSGVDKKALSEVTVPQQPAIAEQEEING